MIDAFVRDVAGDAAAAQHPELRTSDGRIMLRRPGYVIPPHRDPKWGFVTGLVYLARDGDPEEHGTSLYRVRGDEEAPSDKPYYVEESRCELVKTVPFRANTLLAFLNSTGAHGATIPADAKPATLERYVYQFGSGRADRRFSGCSRRCRRSAASGRPAPRRSRPIAADPLHHPRPARGSRLTCGCSCSATGRASCLALA